MDRLSANHQRHHACTTGLAPTIRASGITLIELVITLAVIGTLAAIAIPNYERHLTRAHRSDATVSLIGLANRQQQHFSRTLTYTDDVTELGYHSVTGPSITHSADQHYLIEITLANTVDQPPWKAVATPAPDTRQSRDAQCAKFILHANGARAAENNMGADTTAECWRTGRAGN